MMIFAEALLSLVLTALGYLVMCSCLKGQKIGEFYKNISPPNIKRIVFIASEAATLLGIVFFLNLHAGYKAAEIIKCIALLAAVFPAAAVDLKKKIIPNVFIVSALVMRVLIYAAEFIIAPREFVSLIIDDFAGALIIGGFFLILLLVFKNSIGMGDIKLFAVIGVYQGLWAALSSVFASLVFSFVICIILLISKKKGRRDMIPFGPCILAGLAASVILSGI